MRGAEVRRQRRMRELHGVQGAGTRTGMALGGPDDLVPEQRVTPDLRPQRQRIAGQRGVPRGIPVGEGARVGEIVARLRPHQPQHIAHRPPQSGGVPRRGQGLRGGGPGVEGALGAGVDRQHGHAGSRQRVVGPGHGAPVDDRPPVPAPAGDDPVLGRRREDLLPGRGERGGRHLAQAGDGGAQPAGDGPVGAAGVLGSERGRRRRDMAGTDRHDAPDQAAQARQQGELPGAGAARGGTAHGDVVRVPAEGGRVGAHPAQQRLLVLQAPVGEVTAQRIGEVLVQAEPQDAEPVVEGDHDHVRAGGQPGPVVGGHAARTGLPAAAVDVHHHGPAAAGAGRPHVGVQRVLAVGRHRPAGYASSGRRRRRSARPRALRARARAVAGRRSAVRPAAAWRRGCRGRRRSGRRVRRPPARPTCARRPGSRSRRGQGGRRR